MDFKAVLLCGLWLAGAPRARADDPPPVEDTAPAEPVIDAADLNADGTVTNKEKRQKRRADRRSRRRASGSINGGGDDSGDDAEADEEQDAEATADSSSRGAKAAASASKAAAALKSSLPSTSAGGGIGGGGGGGPGGGGPGGSGPGSGGVGGDLRGGAPTQNGTVGGTPGAGPPPATFPAGSGAGGGPANPKTQADFALAGAAKSPYAPAFAKTGLKLGADGKTVTRLDGSPATAEDYSRLQQEISSMPEALGRRPDFFSAITPERYSDLKKAIKDEKNAGIYKDVGTTEGGRDFVHTASCDKLSKDCNKNVETPYKKGEFVAPEDLDTMWASLQKELDGSAAKDEEEDGTDRRGLGARREQTAGDAATDAASEPSFDGASKTEASGTAAPGAAAVPPGTPAAAIASVTVSAKRLWKTVAMGLPGADGKAQSGTGLLILIGAAAAMLSLVGVVIARRKG